MSRDLPVAFICEGGPLDGQIENLWPDSLGDEVALLSQDALRVQSPGLWFAVYRVNLADRVLTFDRWEWREHPHAPE